MDLAVPVLSSSTNRLDELSRIEHDCLQSSDAIPVRRKCVGEKLIRCERNIIVFTDTL